MNEGYGIMTGGPNLESLLDCLKKFIEEDLKEYRLPVKQDGWTGQPERRVPDIHEMAVPEPSEEHERIPYILLQVLNGRDERGSDGQMKSIVNVRIIITIYDDDMQGGKMQVLQIVQRLRRDLIRAGVIGGCFALQWPLEYLIYPDETEWYHLGEMATQWSIPTEERDTLDQSGFEW